MKEKLKNGNKGITLIALIITIIVMLILVVTAVSVTINSGLFAKAGEATREWKANEETEQQLANGQVTINNKAYNNIDEYVEESKTKKITFYILKNDGTVEYKVAVGTTWEEFLNENKIYDCGDLFIEIDFGICGVDSGSICPEGAEGALGVGGGAPIFESTGTYDAGPWVYPTDPIKEGVTYNCVR